MICMSKWYTNQFSKKAVSKGDSLGWGNSYMKLTMKCNKIDLREDTPSIA